MLLSQLWKQILRIAVANGSQVNVTFSLNLMATYIITATHKFMVYNCSNKKAAQYIEWSVSINTFKTHQFMADHSKANFAEDYFHSEI